MAVTDNDSLKTELQAKQAGAADQQTYQTENKIAQTSAQNTQMAAPAYADQNRINELNRMYESQLSAQKNALETAYNQNLSDLEANRNKIAQQYQTQRNAAASDFERQRRNFNEQAMLNGINTGAKSQANLAQNAAYQKTQGALGASEASANADLNKSIADLKIKYQGDINNAVAENDYKKAAALLDEYNNAYSQALTKAQMLAQYGDFSGYSDIYGAENARQMGEVWAIQNPLIAYNTGKIDANKYKSITGEYPPGYTAPNSGGGYGGGYEGGGGPTIYTASDGTTFTTKEERDAYEKALAGVGGTNGNASKGPGLTGAQRQTLATNGILNSSDKDIAASRAAANSAYLDSLRKENRDKIAAFMGPSESEKKLLQDPAYRNFMGLIDSSGWTANQ